MKQVLLCLVPMVALLGLADPAFSDGASDLTGVWRLVKEVNRRADGSIVVAGRQDGNAGLLIYTASGHVSAHIVPRGRRWKPGTATLQEVRETVEAGTASFGRYVVDPSSSTVTHIVEGSLDPSAEGTHLTRKFTLSGDTLVLSGTWAYGGQTLTFEITWARAN